MEDFRNMPINGIVLALLEKQLQVRRLLWCLFHFANAQI